MPGWSAELETRHSHGLDQFCASLEERPGLSILDLAGASQSTVSFVTNYGHRLYSDDFVHQLDAIFGEGDFRRSLPRFDDAHMAANQKVVDVVKSVAARHAASPAQVALAWVLAVAPDAVPIPGTKRKAYLDDNLGALNVHLAASDTAELDHLAAMAVGDRYSPAMAKIAER